MINKYATVILLSAAALVAGQMTQFAKSAPTLSGVTCAQIASLKRGDTLATIQQKTGFYPINLGDGDYQIGSGNAFDGQQIVRFRIYKGGLLIGQVYNCSGLYQI